MPKLLVLSKLLKIVNVITISINTKILVNPIGSELIISLILDIKDILLLNEFFIFRVKFPIKT
jgi:hypothetical protein